MKKSITTLIYALSVSLICAGAPCSAEEELVAVVSEASPGSIAGTARVEAYFIPACAGEKNPRLKEYLKSDPGFGKLIFSLSGFPVNEEITFEVKRLAALQRSGYEPLMTLRVLPDGTLVTDQNKHVRVIAISGRGYLPGERATFRFRTADGRVSSEVAMYPQPIIARDKDGDVTLRAELVSILPTVYNIELPKMPDGEEYELKSISMGEVAKSKAKYNAHVLIHYSPEVQGRAKGSSSRLEIKSKSGGTYVITVPWGTLLKSYLSGDLSYP